MRTNIYTARRNALGKKIGEGNIVLINSAEQVVRNGDVHFPFRQNSDFRYFTGFDEPHAQLLIVGGGTPRSILHCAPKDEVKELWEGVRMGPEEAKRLLGFDETYSIEDHLLDKQLQRLLLTGHAGVANLDTPENLIAEMRLIKDAGEIALMQKAAKISAGAHRDMLFFARAGKYEYEIEAALAYHFRSAGADALHAYPSIVASGKNALTLHYTKNGARLKSGDLLLIDAGCEYAGYASDITRTFPVSGTFTKAQRALYDVVLSAQKEAIATIAVGTPFQHVHDKTCEVVTEGLLMLGIIKASSLDYALMKKLYKPFFPHGTSHWLGMDVHDVGDYGEDPKTKRKERRLERGMVLTVEPGVYVRPNPEIPKEYWNIGIRIEDDVLVTQRGRDVLSKAAPKDPEEIESLMLSSDGGWW